MRARAGTALLAALVLGACGDSGGDVGQPPRPDRERVDQLGTAEPECARLEKGRTISVDCPTQTLTLPTVP